MKFYIATKLDNAVRAHVLAETLTSFGWTHTYDWTTHGCVLGSGKVLQGVAEKELRGVIGAELFIALLPGGRGTHTELSVALMSGCNVVLHSEDPAPFNPALKDTRSFYLLGEVERV